MLFFLSFFVAAILLVVGFFHLYWAFGGMYGLYSAGPKLEGDKDFVPPKYLIFIVACLIFALAALAILLKFPLLGMETGFYYLGCLVALVFSLRAVGDFKYVGFFKKIYNSDFAKKDTLYFSPLCLFLGLAFLLLSVIDG